MTASKSVQPNNQANIEKNLGKINSFFSSFPGMACRIHNASPGAIQFTYASEGSITLLAHTPDALKENPSLFIDMILEEDRPSFFASIEKPIEQGPILNWEGRIAMPNTREIKWVNLRCSRQQLPNNGTQWDGVMFNITQTKAAEIELTQSQKELRELSLHIQDVVEKERLNIAREVHDHIGGILTAIKFEVSRLSIPSNPLQHLESIRNVDELVDKCLQATSNISRMLRPGILDSFGLIAAIEMELEEFRKRTGIAGELHIIDEGLPSSPELEIALFRIFQEILTNTLKHAQATQIKVTIRNQEDGFQLTTQDNGKGLIAADTSKPNSFGIRGIKERIVHLEGAIHFLGLPNQGTTIDIFIPRLKQNLSYKTKTTQ